MVTPQIGRTAPVFADASTVAAAIAEAQFTYDIGDIYYNKYHSPVKYELSTVPFFNKDKIEVPSPSESDLRLPHFKQIKYDR